MQRLARTLHVLTSGQAIPAPLRLFTSKWIASDGNHPVVDFAKELAYFAGVTPATASSHLSRLLGGNLLAMEKQGRCHYYRLRSAEVARAIEGLMTVATTPSSGSPAGSRRIGQSVSKR